MMTEPELIQPRTARERRAYVSGWDDAIRMVESDGMAAAKVWLEEMAQMELDLMNRNRENPSGAQQEQ